MPDKNDSSTTPTESFRTGPVYAAEDLLSWGRRAKTAAEREAFLQLWARQPEPLRTISPEDLEARPRRRSDGS
jgi:hypothetical protein